jgi:hypothetical protein
MQILRELSKSSVVLCATGLFAVLMIASGFEHTFSGIAHKLTSYEDRKIEHKVKRLQALYHAENKREPTDAENRRIKQQAIAMAHYQERFRQFFVRNHYELSTKQLLKSIQMDKRFEPLLQHLDRIDSGNRESMAEQLKDIKESIRHEHFQDAIQETAIIQDSDVERLRNAFMQERSYQWIKVNASYLIKDEKNQVNNEADIQQYYENNDFPSTPTVQFKYILLRPETIKHTVTSQFIHSLIEKGTITQPTEKIYNLQIQQLSHQKTQHALRMDELIQTIDAAEIPSTIKHRDVLYFSAPLQKKLSLEEMAKTDIPAIANGQSTFTQHKGQWRLVSNLGISQQPCTSTACIDHAKKTWIQNEQQHAQEKQIARLQEQKLYHPKDISKVAANTKHTLHQSAVHTPESLAKRFRSQTLAEALFDPSAPKDRISDPITLPDGNSLIYQVTEHNPSQKKAIETVRDHIAKILHQQHMLNKLKNDLSVAIKQLHNGDGIDTLTKKFETAVEFSKPNEAPRTLPTHILQAATRIPSGDIGWTKPILEYDPTSRSWYLVSLRAVVYTDKNNSAVENIIADEKLHSLLKSIEISSIYRDILS